MSSATGKQSYAGRFGLIGLLVVVAIWAAHDRSKYKLGTDLQGGSILVYKIKPEALEQGTLDFGELTQALKKRLDPDGLKSYQIRSLGQEEVEIIMPAVSEEEKDDVKRRISTVGQLRFRIIADKRAHNDIMEMASRQWPEGGPKRLLIGQGALVLGEFVPFGKWVATTDRKEREAGKALDWSKPDKQFEVYPGLRFVPTTIVEGYKADEDKNHEIRELDGKKYILAAYEDDELGFDSLMNMTRTDEYGQRYVLVFNDRWNVTGDYLKSARKGVDPDTGNPIVEFNLNLLGGEKFGGLTDEFKKRPDGLFRLGIVFDSRLRTAPSLQSKISDRGQITGIKEPELSSIVKILNAGKLPVALETLPEREFSMAATLGEDTIRNAAISVVLSLVVIGVFMVFYYRLAGVVSVLALVLNILFTVALMVLIQQTWTLPGLAGLVLTVGMSVDANVLVFERMREELDRGATFPTAVRLGYERAWLPILDSNITSFATAAILYAIGTDQVRGFAVTLVLGILTGMFSALTCTRVVFELLYERRIIRTLSFLRLLSSPNYNFLRYMRGAMIGSAILIAIGVLTFAARGKDNFDIDFTGGTLAGLRFNKKMETAEVRKLASESGIKDVGVERISQGSFEYFQIRTTEKETKEAPGALRKRIADAFKGLLELTQMKAAAATDVAAPKAEPGKPAPTVDKFLAPFVGGKQTTLTFAEPATVDYVRAKMEDAVREADANVSNPALAIAVEPLGESKETFKGGRRALGYKEFRVATTRSDLDKMVAGVNARLASLPEFESFSSFGPQAAGEMQLRAFVAVFLSWCFIIFWVGYRFSNWSFGLGGVAALVHDVLMSMGLVAIVSTLGASVPALENFFITDMKINLDMVAAILTLIGYSIHDTIVTFDRVRELRGKGSKVTPEMINRAINETLSRTIITSLLTWISVFILFVGGGASVRGFAFLLVVGLITGTYSTIFIANPVVIWVLARKPKAPTPAAAA